MPDIVKGRCTGCMFDPRKFSHGCKHRERVKCAEDDTIVVEDLEAYKVSIVTQKLAGETE